MNYQDCFMNLCNSTINKYDNPMDCQESRQDYFLKNCIRREDFNQLLYDIASQINENQDNSITGEG